MGWHAEVVSRAGRWRQARPSHNQVAAVTSGADNDF